VEIGTKKKVLKRKNKNKNLGGLKMKCETWVASTLRKRIGDKHPRQGMPRETPISSITKPS